MVTHKWAQANTCTQTQTKVTQPSPPPDTQTNWWQNALFPIQIKVSVNINVKVKTVRHTQTHLQIAFTLGAQTQILNFKSRLVHYYQRIESCTQVTLRCVCTALSRPSVMSHPICHMKVISEWRCKCCITRRGEVCMCLCVPAYVHISVHVVCVHIFACELC